MQDLDDTRQSIRRFRYQRLTIDLFTIVTAIEASSRTPFRAVNVQALSLPKMPQENPDAEGPSRSDAATRTRASARPRAGIQRKSKAEREEYARKEAERLKEREVKDTAQTVKTATARGRGTTRGGRVAAVANNIDRTAAPATGGVFGAGTVQRPQRSKAVDLGVSEALDGEEPKPATTATPATPAVVVDVEAIESRKTAKGRGKAAKAEDVMEEAVQVDEDLDEQPRRDIERIWISSDDDDDPIISRKGKERRLSKTSKPFSGLRPVRAVRNISEVGQDDKRHSSTRKSTADENNLLDVLSDETQREDAIGPIRKDNPSSPEVSKRFTKKADGRVKDPRILTETVEERAERLRLQDDVQKMRAAFLYKSDTDEAVSRKEEDAELGRSNHERMFLFQFPPLVPHLLNRAANEKRTDEAMEVDDVQVKVEDSNIATAAPPAAAINVDVPEKPIEDGKPVSVQLPTTYTADAGPETRLPEGFVGKLRIHKSGKVSLDWGGTDMEVRYGTEVDFLQDVVYVEEDSTSRDDQGELNSEGSGVAYAMGQVHQKMVLVPDWARLYA